MDSYGTYAKYILDRHPHYLPSGRNYLETQPNLSKLTQEEVITTLQTRFDKLTKFFSILNREIDEAFTHTQKITDEIMGKFTSNVIALSSKILGRIATHPSSSTADKLTATVMLMEINSPSDLLVETLGRIATHPSSSTEDKIAAIVKLIEVNPPSDLLLRTCTQVAADLTSDIYARIFAANILLEKGYTEKAIAAYKTIKGTIERTHTQNLIEVEIRAGYITEIGVGLYKAGEKDIALEILRKQFNWLSSQIRKKTKPVCKTDKFVTMIEILFDAGKIADRKKAIGKIRWILNNMFSGSFFYQTIINGAETAERMGDFEASREFFRTLTKADQEKKIQDRMNALKTKLAAHQAAN